MTTVRFEQDHGVGTIVLANPPSNRISSQFAVDLRAAVHDASLSDSQEQAQTRRRLLRPGPLPRWECAMPQWRGTNCCTRR